jgi:hypothetical protein
MVVVDLCTPQEKIKKQDVTYLALRQTHEISSDKVDDNHSLARPRDLSTFPGFRFSSSFFFLPVPTKKSQSLRMLSILRKARLKDKEMRILML